MLSSKKNKSIVSILRDRELNIKHAPYFSGLKIASQLIRSDNKSLYSNTWKKSSPKEISYDFGNLYFSNYTEYCPVNVSNNKPPPFYKIEQPNRRKRVSDIISYSGVSVCKNMELSCQCEAQRCMCLSQYLLTISEDNWLCQHSMSSGKLMKQIYVNLNEQNIKFKYCDWDMYGERFILTTTRNPFHYNSVQGRSDVVAYLAVFTAFPVEFYALMEIKRSVFGLTTTAVSITNQSLIIGLSSTHVAIYNFDEFLNGGTLTPYKLNEPYGSKGKIGSYPTGLPLNFTYYNAPPVLFNVKCVGQIVRFGGYPYHYIIINSTKLSGFSITPVSAKNSTDIIRTEPNYLHDVVDTVMFHPDKSNRIILKKERSIDVYNIHVENDCTRLSKSFSMGLLCITPGETITTTHFGRKIKPLRLIYDFPHACVLCSDYEDELEIFAVLAKYLCEDQAFVLLYDSVTGEELRTITLKGKFCDSKMYQIYMDLYAIIIIERDLLSRYTVYVYIM